MAIYTGVNSFVNVGYADTSSTFTTEACTEVGNPITHAYITDRTMRVWDPEAAVTVYADGTPMTTGYTVYHAGGYITFSPTLTAGTAITVTGKYIPVAELCLAKSFSVDVTWNTEDATTIPCTATAADAGWQKNKGTTRSISGSLELLMDDTAAHPWRDAILGNPDDEPAVVGGEVLYLELGITSSWTLHILCWPSISITANASSLNGETVSFVGADSPPFLI